MDWCSSNFAPINRFVEYNFGFSQWIQLVDDSFWTCRIGLKFRKTEYFQYIYRRRKHPNQKLWEYFLLGLLAYLIKLFVFTKFFLLILLFWSNDPNFFWYVFAELSGFFWKSSKVVLFYCWASENILLRLVNIFAFYLCLFEALIWNINYFS